MERGEIMRWLLVGVVVAGLAGSAYALPAGQQETDGAQIVRDANNQVAALTASLEVLRRRIDAVRRASTFDPKQEHQNVAEYVVAATAIRNRCELVLRERTAIAEKFSNLRAAYGKAIAFYHKAGAKQYREAKRLRAESTLPPEQVERAARQRERLAEIYDRARASCEQKVVRFNAWEATMMAKLGVVRARTALLDRTIETAKVMEAVSQEEADAQTFLRYVHVLNAALEHLVDDIAKTIDGDLAPRKLAEK